MRFRVRPELLDKIRVQRGLNSDEALARLLNVSLGTVSAVRRGGQPAATTLIKLLEAAGVTDIRAAIIPMPETGQPAA